MTRLGIQQNRITQIKHEIFFLRKLLDELAKGKIRISRFQRSFAWRPHQMLRLLDSIALGYPIGSVLLLDTQLELSCLDHVGPLSVGPPSELSTRLVIDGQQRLSTLAGCLLLDDGDDDQAEGVTWRLYYDLRHHKFIAAPPSGTKPYHFPVWCLLSTSKFLSITRKISEQNFDDQDQLLMSADNLANAFFNYQIPVTTVSDADLDTVTEIFTRTHQ